ncbi:MAG TPA: IS21 family transposase [Candidatus Polarisedimenticolia bacterium]|nr:IS21 family transposase [Candidatus Polarisedimenticolia bacterium]
MISAEIRAQILRLYHAEGWRIGTLARQLGLHHSTVRRILAQEGLAVASSQRRPSMLDPYRPFLQETLQQFPTLPASRLYEMVRQRGYPGRPDHFRHRLAELRPKPPAEAYLRLRTLPGEQAQVDWGHFGTLAVAGGKRPLVAFVMVLSYSRQIFVRFFLHQRLESFLRGHEAAFAAWGGVPRILLYDNLKSVVLERRGAAIRFHPQLLRFAGHYRYEPRPVAPARGNEKGRVERAIAYLRTSFFPARRFTDLDDLNAQAEHWCRGPAAERLCPEQRTRTVREVFDQEREHLRALPELPFPTEERQSVQVAKTPYARFDGNDYSVPADHVRRTLVVLASATEVRLVDGREIVAVHARCWGLHQQIEDPRHLEALSESKRQARKHRDLDRLESAAPQSRPLLVHLAQRGASLRRATSELLALLDQYGPTELDRALGEALAQGSPHPQTVRLILERRHDYPAQLPLPLPENPRVRELLVRPHDLAGYDRLSPTEDPDDDEPA